MIKIFVDTNIVFAFWKAFVSNNFSLNRTSFGINKALHCYTSNYIVSELITVCERHNILWNDEYYADLLILLNIQHRDGQGSQDEIIHTVYDVDDAQIVADALALGCNYLLTHNTDDFDIILLQEEYGLVCIQSLQQI